MVAALLVVARPPPDLAESGPLVEPPRRLVVLVHFEEHRVRTQAGEPPPALVEEKRAPDIVWVGRLAVAADDTTKEPKPLYLRAPDAQPQDAARLPRR